MSWGAIHGAQSIAGEAAPGVQERASPAADGSAFARQLKAQQLAPQRQQLVRAARTQLTSEQARDALGQAWAERFGTAPRQETTAILTAQWAHETGNGRSMFNYNFGGIKGTGPSGLSVAQRTKEGWGPSERTIVDKFRAYQTPSEGAADYLSLLSRRYPRAVEAADQGDPAKFVRELKAGGYFTGNEASYVRSVSQRAAQLLGGPPPKSSSANISAATQPPEQGANSASAGVPSQTRPPLGHASNRQPATASPSPLDRAQLAADRGPRLADADLAAVRLSALDDALSRAALSIALSTGRPRKDML